MGPYESPTFLGKEQKVAFGMSMSRLMLTIGVALGAIFVSFLLPLPWWGQGICFVLLTAVALVVLNVRISGVKVIPYVGKAVVMTLRRPAYSSNLEEALTGERLQFQVASFPDDANDELPTVTPGKGGKLELFLGPLARPVAVGLGRMRSAGGGRLGSAAVRLKGKANDKTAKGIAQAEAESISVNAALEARAQARSVLQELKGMLKWR